MFVVVSISENTAVVGLFSDATSGPSQYHLCYEDYPVSVGELICSAAGLGMLQTTRLLDVSGSTGPWLKVTTRRMFELTEECSSGKIVGLECQMTGN